MPIFQFHLRQRTMIEPDEAGLECRDLHDAYLKACNAIPDMARDLLIKGQDPLECSYILCDHTGARLMEILFAELLSPTEWRLRRARRRPHDLPRSSAARDDLALSSFRRMFANVNVGCVLLTPDLQVREINEFGARHSHVDPEAIRDTSILDVFDLSGEPKDNFGKFWSLAQLGAVSELIDMPYLVLDAEGQTANGWWNARVWPIFDDDERLLGLVEWAEPFTSPSAGGETVVRIAEGSSKW